jgi:hypothetical protein
VSHGDRWREAKTRASRRGSRRSNWRAWDLKELRTRPFPTAVIYLIDMCYERLHAIFFPAAACVGAQEHLVHAGVCSRCTSPSDACGHVQQAVHAVAACVGAAGRHARAFGQGLMSGCPSATQTIVGMLFSW